MATTNQNLKQRTKDEPTTTTTTTTNNNNKRSTSTTGRSKIDDKRMAMAKRGLRSLSIAIAIPLSLTFFTISLSGTGHKYETIQKPFWFPPLWALHAASLAKAVLMGLSAWLVWAEGGFHQQPTAVPLFASQLVLCLLWDPVVFSFGSPGLGMMVSIGLFATLVGCLKTFGAVNPIASDLVKPCLAWVAYLTLVNLKLLHVDY